MPASRSLLNDYGRPKVIYYGPIASMPQSTKLYKHFPLLTLEVLSVSPIVEAELYWSSTMIEPAGRHGGRIGTSSWRKQVDGINCGHCLLGVWSRWRMLLTVQESWTRTDESLIRLLKNNENCSTKENDFGNEFCSMNSTGGELEGAKSPDEMLNGLFNWEEQAPKLRMSHWESSGDRQMNIIQAPNCGRTPSRKNVSECD